MSGNVKEILAGLGALIAFLAVVGALFFGTLANTEKVTEMTRLCVQDGFTGWDDDKGCFR